MARNRQIGLLQLLFGILAMLSIVGFSIRLGGIAGVGVFLGGLVLLGLSAHFWGFDSRDGSSWRS